MRKNILTVPLRERLFMVCESYFTYSDVYVSVIHDSSLFDTRQNKEKTIRPVRYYIIENDELAPLSELVKEKVFFFTEQQFKYHPENRMKIYELMKRFICDNGVSEEEGVDAQVKELFTFIDMADMYFMHDYEEEFREFFTKKNNIEERK